MSSEFGRALKIQIFGASHGRAIGVTADGLPAGEHIDAVPVSKAGGVVRVRGAGLGYKLFVISRVLIGVFDNGAERGAACHAVLKAGEKHRPVLLAPRRR